MKRLSIAFAFCEIRNKIKIFTNYVNKFRFARQNAAVHKRVLCTRICYVRFLGLQRAYYYIIFSQYYFTIF